MNRLLILGELSGADDAAARRRGRINDWHELIRTRDVERCRSWLADDIVFHSPAMADPKRGPDEVIEVLGLVVTRVFAGFQYHRELVTPRTWVLEFSATVGGTHCKGVDIIQWDRDCGEPAARIAEFEVMIRPFPALAIVRNEMTRLLVGDAEFDFTKL
jgi:hypothetical protein